MKQIVHFVFLLAVSGSEPGTRRHTCPSRRLGRLLQCCKFSVPAQRLHVIPSFYPFPATRDRDYTNNPKPKLNDLPAVVIVPLAGGPIPARRHCLGYVTLRAKLARSSLFLFRG